MNYYGSICLTDVVSTGQARKAENGKIYLNIAVRERKEVGEYGDTHFITCAPKKEERLEGVNYIIGNLKPSKFDNAAPTPEQIAEMPVADVTGLPF